MSFFTRPINMSTLNTVFGKRFVRTARSKEFISFIYQHTGCVYHIGFLFHCTCRKQDILLRNAITYGKHCFQYGAGSIHTYTTDFTGGSHIYPQHRVGFLQTVEGELGSLDSNIVQFKKILFRFFDRQAKHYFRCQFDKVYLQYLADKRERAAGTQVAFDHLDIIIFCQILDIERTGNVQSLGNLTADTLDAANRLHI